MNEYTIGLTASISLLGLVLSSVFYMIGGRSKKFIRRYISSLCISASLVASAIVMQKFSWWLCLTYPCLVIGFSFGYGGDSLIKKIIRRTVYALAILSASVVCAIVYQGNAWNVLLLHALFALSSVFFAIKNPIHAAAEEVFVSVMLNLGLLMYPFVM